MLTQIHKVKSFLTQQTASSGRGPCSLSRGRADIEIQMCVARVYAAEFNNNEAHSAALHENTNPQIFILSSGARHRPVKTKTSIQGKYVQKKKQKKTTVKKTSHIGLATSNNSGRSYSHRERNQLLTSLFSRTCQR